MKINEWTGNFAKIFVSNLATDKPIIYTGKILSVDENFVTISAQGVLVSVNIRNIIQIKSEEEL
jgi:hypothetical protein